MLVFSAAKLQSVTEQIFTAMGSPAAEVREFAEVLVESNLAGHDSHGIIRIPQYVNFFKTGAIKLGAPIQIVRETAAMAVIDGGMNLGHLTMMRALEIAVKKAEQTAVATVMVRGCNHIGRVGAYPLRAARKGFACVAGVNSPGGRCVAPWGGLDRKMGTNPLAIAAPTRGEPLVLDMTTSVVAEGKVRVQHHKKLPTPADWLIDHDGNPTTNAAALYNKPAGALLPLGGSVGYKGFGLGVMMDILAGAMSGAGAIDFKFTPGPNGVWLTLWNVNAFIPIEEYLAEVDRLTEWIKSSRRKPGVDEILLPGEVEARMTAKRLKEGVPVPEETWDQLCAAAAQVGVQVNKASVDA